MTPPADITRIANGFSIAGEIGRVERTTAGHINESFRVHVRDGPRARSYLLQRVNSSVFPDPLKVMENIERVTAHLQARLPARAREDADRRVLTPIKSRGGASVVHDDAGEVWRMYRFIERAQTFTAVQNVRQAETAAAAFGEFQSLLADYSGPRLHETIADFHHTVRRYEALEQAVCADRCRRAADARAEIQFAMQRRASAGALIAMCESGSLPERIVHNDAKIANVLFDEGTGDPLCVIDLDTVMPGLTLYDFGDMVRSMTTPAREDETDLSTIDIQLPLFAALVRGYLNATRDFLTAPEREHLVTAGRLISLEQGVRFLTDYLIGDIYYRTQRSQQNVHRCRAQFKLVESIERHTSDMERIVQREGREG